jgi:glucose/arabinose dehydrogenase
VARLRQRRGRGYRPNQAGIQRFFYNAEGTRIAGSEQAARTTGTRVLEGAMKAMTRNLVLACGLLTWGCDGEHGGGGVMPIDGGAGNPGGGGGKPALCDTDNAGLTLPSGFCARVFATQLGKARHLAVSKAGDVYVAVPPAADGSNQGGIVALRDADGDGRAEQQETFGAPGGNGIALAGNELYLARNDSIVRFSLSGGSLVPTEEPQTLVKGLPATGDHVAKSVVVKGDAMFVNIGSATNSCQVANRQLESPGIDPCPELEVRAGIWKFTTHDLDQRLEDGIRFAKGARNSNALALNARGHLFAVQNGRDQLYENWPELYSAEDDQRLPTEDLIRVKRGADYGWPYCYHDPDKGFVLAPEYGGDGTIIGGCDEVEESLVAYPAHWAPLGMTFYRGKQFPRRYRGGAFIAFHGSRFAPDAMGELPGYNVIFQPFRGDVAVGEREVFASGFAGSGRPLPEQAAHRPVGVAEGSDGSLYVSDDYGGTIWRIAYVGE